MKLYSVLTCITGNYERVREVENPSSLVDYILVTDNKNLTSNTWNIVFWDCPFDFNDATKYMYIKYHPFEFVDTDTVVWIDGSIQILNDFSQELMFDFIGSDYSIAETENIIQNYCRGELKRWSIGWGSEDEPKPFYGYSTAQKVLDFFDKHNFETDGERGMVQTTLYMCKNNKLSNMINNVTWTLALQLGDSGESDRQIMAIRSYVVDNYTDFKNDVMLLSPTILWCNYFDYRFHGTDNSQKDSFANVTVLYPQDYRELYNHPFKFNDDLIVPKILPY